MAAKKKAARAARASQRKTKPANEATAKANAADLDFSALAAPGELAHIPLGRIHLSPLQPRKILPATADEAAFGESVATAWILQPVLLRPHPKLKGQYELVAGERRIRHARAAVKAKRQPATRPVPAMVKKLGEREALAAAVLENVARDDMHPLDECRAYAALEKLGAGTAAIARLAKRSQRDVQRYIKVWRDLPETGKAALAKGKIGIAQARALAAIPDEGMRAAITKEVIEQNRDWMNEDWIELHWKQLVERRAEAAKQRAADKADPKAAAKRKAEARGAHRSHQRQIDYPKPNAAGIYDWPAKRSGDEVYSETDPDDDGFEGEVVSIGVRLVAIRKGDSAWDHVHAAGYVVRVEGWPPLEEPITEKTGAGRSWEVIQAAEARAIDALLATPPKAADPHARAWLRDAARIIGDRYRAGSDNPKRRKALAEKLDALQAALFPAPSSPAADPRAALSVAKPDVSAPLTDKLVIPPAAAEKNDAGDTDGLRLVGRHDHEKTRNTSARLAGVPDFVHIERNGRVFSYGFIAERQPAAAKKPPKAIPAAHAPAAE